MNEVINYYVNEEKRTVAATMLVDDFCVVQEALSIADKRAGHLFKVENLTVHPCFEMKRKYTGVAKCHPEDVFDVEKGMEIARLKAIQKYLVDKKKKTKKLAEAFTSMSCSIDSMDNHTTLALINTKNKLDNIHT